MPAADTEPADPVDDGREHDREQSADVEDFKLLRQLPGQTKGDQDEKEEDDVAAGGGRGGGRGREDRLAGVAHRRVGSFLVGRGSGLLNHRFGSNASASTRQYVPVAVA